MKHYTKMVFLFLALLFLSVASAAEKPVGIETQKTPVLGSTALDKLNLAREYAEKSDFKTALRATKHVRYSNKSTDYERAMAWNIAAYCHFEIQQIEKAALAYGHVLKQRGLPSNMYDTARFSIAQLYMAEQRWEDAATALRNWIDAKDTPTAQAYTFLGQAYYQMKDYDRARPELERAVSMLKEAGEVPKENLYLLLRAIYFAQKDYLALRDVLESLVLDYPKKDYWVQMAAVYGELAQPGRQLAAMDYAFQQGLLTSRSEYVTLAQLMLSNNVPYRAALIIESGMQDGVVQADDKAYRILADAWVMAKEYKQAVEALEKALSVKLSGELQLRLAQLYMETSSWSKAAMTATAAVQSGELKRPDIASIVAGLALYELGRLGEAESAFGQAAEYKKSEAMARQWQNFISKEQQRRSALGMLQQG